MQAIHLRGTQCLGAVGRPLRHARSRFRLSQKNLMDYIQTTMFSYILVILSEEFRYKEIPPKFAIDIKQNFRKCEFHLLYNIDLSTPRNINRFLLQLFRRHIGDYELKIFGREMIESVSHRFPLGENLASRTGVRHSEHVVNFISKIARCIE